ncbi:ParB N-terminal domain-containing protein [Hymenobacter crusticola]|uniref:ParB-like N-terminal domain-containing protein n=1 Tax=Hymenobacter crusticola TaxID=1770526 RepID=A0A2C9ZTP9_9BACT|nr:ParB N-terminal domain-containing protein [Hymenobacter crusticola]OUJ65585.1 hypothetical protein BXP70_29145 [Hymenobacter crusticola]
MTHQQTFSLQHLPIEQVRLNDANPRLIQDARFQALKKSLVDFPEMLTLRPLVVDEAYVVLGGNMRLQALLQLRYTEVPVVVALGLTEQQKREFILKDNASFGEWDWDVLANEWSDLPLQEWLDVPRSWGAESQEEGTSESLATSASSLTIIFSCVEHAQQAQADIQQLLAQKYAGATLTLSLS